MVERLLRQLRQGSESTRYRAALLLKDVPKSREVLLALTQALADPGFYETPGDYDAPTFHYAVAWAAAEALQCPEAAQVREEVLALARSSEVAAFYAGRVLAYSGEPATLNELLRHPSQNVREQAVRSIRPMMDHLGDPQRLLPLLLESLMGDGVTHAAVHDLSYLLKDHPSLRLEAPPDLVARLIARMEREPGACTYFEAAAFFGTLPTIYRTWVDLAARGSHCAADQLRRHPGGLTSEDVGRLVEAPASPQLLGLLAILKDPRAIPHLLPLLANPKLREPALRALLLTPGGAAHVTEWNRWFLELPDLRQLIARHHPDPPRLLPFLRERLTGSSDRQRDGLEMLEALGPAGASLVPLAAPLTRLGVKNPLRLFALNAVLAAAPESPEAEAALSSFLEWSDTADYALKKIVALGPRAARMREILEVMQLEGKRDPALVARALAALSPP